MNTFAKAALCGLYKYTGAMHTHEAVARWAGQQFMTVLLFHRVTDAIPEDGLTVGAGRFRRLCRMLARRFRVVPLAEVFRVLRAGERFPPRTLAITFDDCYRDNLDAAHVLHEHGLPATFFIPTAFVGTDRVFDWDRGLPRLPNLSWEDIRRMAALGFEIGSHTVSHINLGTASVDQARAEIFASRTIIEDQLGVRCRHFAYPFGDRHHIRPEWAPLIQEAGYEGAVSAYSGFVRPDTDDRVLPREAVPYFKSLLHLELYLSGCLHWLYALKGRPGAKPTAPPPRPQGLSRGSRQHPAGALASPEHLPVLQESVR